MTFVDAVISGEAQIDDIDKYVEEWHNSDSKEPLHSFLGLSEEEYKLWLQDENMLCRILHTRINLLP